MRTEEWQEKAAFIAKLRELTDRPAGGRRMTQTEIFSFVVQTLYWFFLYGCIGWGVEVVYAAIKERRLVNRGFLCGPICPIYGCGMVVLNWTVAAM